MTLSYEALPDDAEAMFETVLYPSSRNVVAGTDMPSGDALTDEELADVRQWLDLRWRYSSGYRVQAVTGDVVDLDGRVVSQALPPRKLMVLVRRLLATLDERKAVPEDVRDALAHYAVCDYIGTYGEFDREDQDE